MRIAKRNLKKQTQSPVCHSCENRNPEFFGSWIPHQVRNDKGQSGLEGALFEKTKPIIGQRGRKCLLDNGLRQYAWAQPARKQSQFDAKRQVVGRKSEARSTKPALPSAMSSGRMEQGRTDPKQEDLKEQHDERRTQFESARRHWDCAQPVGAHNRASAVLRRDRRRQTQYVRQSKFGSVRLL